MNIYKQQKNSLFYILPLTFVTFLNATQQEQDFQRPHFPPAAIAISIPYFTFLNLFDKASRSRSSVPYTILNGYIIGLTTGLLPLLIPATINYSMTEIHDHANGLELLEKHFPQRISFGRTVYTPTFLTSITAGTATGLALWYKLISYYLQNR